jgi:membrane-bound inhibitor of C-type lysozyme
MRQAIALLFLTTTALMGCDRKESAPEATADSAAVATTGNAGFEYTCTDGTKFNARIDRGNVILSLNGQDLTLPPDTNASGAHYSGEGTTFIASGRDATLLRSGENARTCNTP